MGPTVDTQQGEGPRVIVHVFETSGGVAQPTKTVSSNEDDLQVALSARRPHRKSRAGCLRCKTRRVKCDEQRPACANCVRKGNSCVYRQSPPTSKTRPARRQNQPTAFPSMTTDTFTIQDMRFFHHFLIKAKPHVPVGNDEVWTKDIPQYAQHNPFLMHAMLALGSTHLGCLIDEDCFKVQSLTYRVRGLDGLRRTVAKSKWDHGDADSLIAAGYALMQQSAYLEDAMFDWISLFRLTHSISLRIAESQQAGTQFDLRPTKHMEHIVPYMNLLPPIDPTILDQAIQELDLMRPVLTDKAAVSLHRSLRHCLKQHQMSPAQGYLAFGAIFSVWLGMSKDEIASFADPLQSECQLLMLHFVAIMVLMVPLGVIENHQTLEWSSCRHIMGIIGWATTALSNIPQRLETYTEFPKTVISTATAEIDGRSVVGPSVLQLDATLSLARQMNALRLGDNAANLGLRKFTS